jgi:SAM-dependent methyltransferase
MNNRFPPGALIQAASAWSLPVPLLIGAVGVVVLLAVVLLVWRWRRCARPTRPAVPAEAPELADLRTAETTEDLRFCVELARSVGGPVLELGAGTGRIALELGQRGLAVTALEPSPRMLQWAKTKAEQRSTKYPVEWIEGELTNLRWTGEGSNSSSPLTMSCSGWATRAPWSATCAVWRTIWSRRAPLSPSWSPRAGKLSR